MSLSSWGCFSVNITTPAMGDGVAVSYKIFSRLRFFQNLSRHMLPSSDSSLAVSTLLSASVKWLVGLYPLEKCPRMISIDVYAPGSA